MRTNPVEHAHLEAVVESVILAELNSAPLTAVELRKRVTTMLPGLKDKQCKAYLDSLVVAQRIHGLPKLGKTGKPTKTLEGYAIGAPPPPPPPPRERAPKEILAVLKAGALSAVELKKRIKKHVPELTAPDLNAILAELAKTHQIYGRYAVGKGGRPAKTIASYAIGGPPVDEFVAPVLAKWKEMRREAVNAGVSDKAFRAALLDGLAREGIQVGRVDSPEPTANDRATVLHWVKELVTREGQGALIPIRKLRSQLKLSKDRFDTAMLELYAEDAIVLHHHDYVGSLSDTERDELVLDRHGNYYIGVALRGAQ